MNPSINSLLLVILASWLLGNESSINSLLLVTLASWLFENELAAIYIEKN